MAGIHWNMTLSERNAFFKIGIVFSFICVILILTASFFIMPVYKTANQSISHDAFGREEITRPSSIFQVFSGIFIKNSYYAVHIAVILSVLFSLFGMILIHSSFERTAAPEMLYIAIFTVSFAFEALRLILPLHFLMNFPSVYIRFTARVLLFARVFCIFSLFAASIYAAGLEIQKNRNVIFIIIIATMLITLRVPIDVLNWDTGMNMVNGFISVFRLIEMAVFVTTMIGFVIAAKIRGSLEYKHVMIGAVLALIGRNILLSTDNWIGLGTGIGLLVFGTWYLCSKLHKIHLWL